MSKLLAITGKVGGHHCAEGETLTRPPPFITWQKTGLPTRQNDIRQSHIDVLTTFFSGGKFGLRVSLTMEKRIEDV